MLTHKGRLGLAFSTLVLALAGCGGHGDGRTVSSSAALKMSIVWPNNQVRLVPNASDSLVAVVTVKGKEVARTLAVRPGAVRPGAVHANSPIPGNSSTTTILLEGLPAGEATVTMTSYPTTDGTGTAQATGTTTETLVAGATTNDATSMSSTVATLSIAPETFGGTSVPLGGTSVLDVSARDAAGSLVLLTSTQGAETLTWASDNASVAAVSASYPSSSATMTGVAEGPANVSVSLVVDDAGTKVTASKPVTVTAAAVRSIAIGGATTATVGQDDPLSATATYSDGTTADFTSQVLWSATSPGAITSEGVFSASAPGTSTVTATFGGVTKTATITVNPARVIQSIAVTPSNSNTPGPVDVQLTATATYSDSTTADVSTRVTWSFLPPFNGGTVWISPSGLFHWIMAPNPILDGTTVTATLGGISSDGVTVQYDMP